MNNKKYLLAGIFVLSTMTMMIIIAVWLSVGLNKPSVNTYVAKFHDVSGLNISSNVFLNGNPVGKVSKISMDEENPTLVDVQVQIISSVQLYEQAYATLQSQGITGQSAVSIKLTDTDNQKLTPIIPRDSAPYPVIKTRPSELTNIIDNINKAAEDLNKMAANLAKIASPENIQAINNTLKNIDEITAGIANRNKNIDEILESTNTIMANTAASSQQFNQITLNTAKILESINIQTLPSLNNVLIPEFSATMYNLNQMTIELQTLIRKLNNNPAALVRGEVSHNPGPGE